MQKKKKTNKGYTLVEMIIVVTIIMFLVTAIAINNNLMRDQVQFSKAFHEVQSVLQYGRNIALSGQAYPDTNDHDKDLLTFDPDGDMVLPNGYIIRLYVDKNAKDPIEVGLYADLFDSNLDQLDIVENGKSDDVPVKEIARRFDISPKTVENHLTEALKKIRKGLGEKFVASLFD